MGAVRLPLAELAALAAGLAVSDGFAHAKHRLQLESDTKAKLLAFSPPLTTIPACTRVLLLMGAVRLELTNSEEEGFTVPCNCHYATPPREKREKDAGERT